MLCSAWVDFYMDEACNKKGRSIMFPPFSDDVSIYVNMKGTREAVSGATHVGASYVAAAYVATAHDAAVHEYQCLFYVSAL